MLCVSFLRIDLVIADVGKIMANFLKKRRKVTENTSDFQLSI